MCLIRSTFKKDKLAVKLTYFFCLNESIKNFRTAVFHKKLLLFVKFLKKRLPYRFFIVRLGSIDLWTVSSVG